MIFRARAVVTFHGPPIADGAVQVKGGRITAVGPVREIADAEGDEITDLGEMVLMPGLINAHCHLDYSMMRHAINPPKSFTSWVQRINALKRQLSDDDYIAAIWRGFAELRKWGCTGVCNIEAFPELMPRLPEAPMRTWWFYEMIDIRHRITSDDVVAGALAFFNQRSRPLESFGLSPHAPYTASVTLYELANQCAETFGMPVTTHVGESREEWEMFHDASGPLYDFMASIQRPMNDCGRGNTPFSQLWKSGAIDQRWLLVHLNELGEEDFEILASLPSGGAPTVIHCPGSHHYFRHSPFPYRRLHELGLNLCLATDSLASTESLSLFAEMRALRGSEPWLTAEQVLHTVTTNPARALGRGHELGRIVIGALADLIAIPMSGSVAQIHEEIIEYTEAVPWMMIDGQILP